MDGDDSKPDETESDWRKLDIPPTQFLELLRSSSEMKNCEHSSPAHSCTILSQVLSLMSQLKAL